MQTETATSAASAGYEGLPKEAWQGFFDMVTKALEGRRTDIEIVSPDVGDQIEAESLPLVGLTYDPKDDTFYVYLDDVANRLNHAIGSPREILIRMVTDALDTVVVVDGDGRRHIVHLRQPLQLPDRT